MVFSWPATNGYKVHILIGECGFPYEAIAVAIGRGGQFDADFLKISPKNKIPATIDPQGPDGAPISLFRFGAILLHLARKAGRFMPESERQQLEVLQWLMFQMGGVGPMFGQAHHFRMYVPKKIAYAINRYSYEARRLYGVIDRRLSQSRYLCGDAYSIADIATFPWLRSWKTGRGARRLSARAKVVRRNFLTSGGETGHQCHGRLTPSDHGRQGARDSFRQHAVPVALKREADGKR